MDISKATVLVAGMGVSGRSACEVLAGRAAHVVTVDEGKSDADYHSFADVDFRGIDLVMSSPVFNPRTPFIVKAQSLGIPVVSEVELGWMLRVPSGQSQQPAPWIGITGTNGKTSTTQMVSAMLTGAGETAPAVGNIGKAVSHAAVDPSNQTLCVELSSFQLHFTQSLSLECAAITNLADDHLDWHGGFANYAADKAKVYRGVQRALVYNADDSRVSELAAAAHPAPGCKRVGFTLGAPQAGEIGVQDGWIIDRSGLEATGEDTAVEDTAGENTAARSLAAVSDFSHLCEPDGTVYPHLLADALCALALVLGHGIAADRAVEALKAFKPGGHRIQTVARYDTTVDADQHGIAQQTGSAHGGNGHQGESTDRPQADSSNVIRFVDDSKATNAHAAGASLSSFPPHSVVWIAGGLAKGGHFEDLLASYADRLSAAVIIGVDQRPMLDAFASKAPDIPLSIIDPEPKESVMQRAVDAAGTHAHPGSVVLMAPACASMDQFVSYADRGEQFAAQARLWVARRQADPHGQK
ncbi:MAG: UDP-N-acetylmuramoyl-L-alanine--D-glutamate ligase [Bifidobacterium psychraerophilum]|uniref:Mur ligase family protein n=1 Tax=Bifidobacterium psychraerophilum TaxID=218140 RepID=UPI0039ECDE29